MSKIVISQPLGHNQHLSGDSDHLLMMINDPDPGRSRILVTGQCVETWDTRDTGQGKVLDGELVVLIVEMKVEMINRCVATQRIKCKFDV